MSHSHVTWCVVISRSSGRIHLQKCQCFKNLEVGQGEIIIFRSDATPSLYIYQISYTQYDQFKSYLGGGFNYIYVHPQNWGRFPI